MDDFQFMIMEGNINNSLDTVTAEQCEAYAEILAYCTHSPVKSMRKLATRLHQHAVNQDFKTGKNTHLLKYNLRNG